MPNFKNIISVDNEEKRLYRIMKELEKNGESLIDDISDDWHGTIRKLGRRTKPLVDNELLEPMWIQRDTHNHDIKKRLIRTPKNVLVEEIPGNNTSFFHFKRRRLI